MGLRDALEGFTSGRLVVNVIDMPIKCPVAPIEFCFLADAYFRKRGIRDQIELTLVTPLDGAFTQPVCNRELGGMLRDKRIEVVTEFNTGEIDADGSRLVSFDGREVGFDLAVVVPVHGGAAYVDDRQGWVTRSALSRSTSTPCRLKPARMSSPSATPPTSVRRRPARWPISRGRPWRLTSSASWLASRWSASFDGHTNCFIESGLGKALLIDFNYDTEPVQGHFPGRFGLPLLRQSRLNHLGKLAFEWLYWHMLLPGHDIPGVPADMPLAGKQPDSTSTRRT